MPTRSARPVTDLHVLAVRHTGRPDTWRTVVGALGGSAVAGRPGEQVFALGGGCLVLRHTSGENSVTTIELGASPGVAPVLGSDGSIIARTVAGDAPTRSGMVAVCPLWMTADVLGASAALQAVGLSVRLASEAGQWVDLLAPGGGLVAVHAEVPPDATGPSHAVLAFEAPDVQDLAGRFEDRGLRADVVDESYGRSLRIDDPDGGTELWVNETMTDLYGYRRGGPA